MKTMDRKQFIKATTLGMVSSITIPSMATNVLQDPPQPLDPKLVKDFVIAGHGKMDEVKDMLEQYPNLISCRHDWGKGDYEEAIEGAGHVGNEDIANYLIEKGARVNLFVLTMLGKTDLVLPILKEYPQLVNSLGAHGFTLLHHANVGGERSLEIKDFLTENGLKETKVNIKG